MCPLPLSPWHFSNTGFNSTEEVDVASICVYGSKIYAGTNHRTAAYHSKVYESNDGITWTLNHTFDDKLTNPTDDQIVSMCIFNGKLYALRNWSTSAWLYSYDGSTWSDAIDLKTGMFIVPTYLITDGTKLYACGGYGTLKNIWSATNPEGAWAVELTTTGTLRDITIVVKYGSDLFASGDYLNVTNGTYVYRKTGGTWDSATQFVNSGYISDGYVFRNKLYFIGNDKSNPSFIYLYTWDGTSWTTTHLSSNYSGTSPSIFVNINNYLEFQAPNNSVGGYVISNLYRSSDGVDFSGTEPYGTSEYNNPPIMPRAHTNFQTRTFLGAGTGAQVGVYYTDVSHVGKMIMVFN
jgi:hypothetical protein